MWVLYFPGSRLKRLRLGGFTCQNTVSHWKSAFHAISVSSYPPSITFSNKWKSESSLQHAYQQTNPNKSFSPQNYPWLHHLKKTPFHPPAHIKPTSSHQFIKLYWMTEWVHNTGAIFGSQLLELDSYQRDPLGLEKWVPDLWTCWWVSMTRKVGATMFRLAFF